MRFIAGAKPGLRYYPNFHLPLFVFAACNASCKAAVVYVYGEPDDARFSVRVQAMLKN